MDGASNVDVGSNITLLSTPTLESIEEFKIITSSYAAEWPRSGGGIVNVVTKSRHATPSAASAYEFYRNDSLNANSFFRKQSSDPAIADKPGPARLQQLRLHPRRPDQEGQALLLRARRSGATSTRAPTSASAATIDPAWLTDPANANYVAPALRDPNAVKLLAAWPAPNTGTNQYRDSAANDQNTRQEVAPPRLEHQRRSGG